MSSLIDTVLGYKVKKEIVWHRQELHILILGAYRPENAKKRLDKLRDCFIERGYSNTHLVADCPDDDEHDENQSVYWERKSNDLMLNSDLNLFVFFANCKNEGVTDELAYFCSKIKKFSGCYVVFEDSYERDVSSRIRAKVERCVLYNTTIKDGDDAELCDAACAFAELVSGGHVKNL